METKHKFRIETNERIFNLIEDKLKECEANNGDTRVLENALSLVEVFDSNNYECGAYEVKPKEVIFRLKDGIIRVGLNFSLEYYKDTQMLVDIDDESEGDQMEHAQITLEECLQRELIDE